MQSLFLPVYSAFAFITEIKSREQNIITKLLKTFLFNGGSYQVVKL